MKHLLVRACRAAVFALWTACLFAEPMAKPWHGDRDRRKCMALTVNLESINGMILGLFSLAIPLIKHQTFKRPFMGNFNQFQYAMLDDRRVIRVTDQPAKIWWNPTRMRLRLTTDMMLSNQEMRSLLGGGTPIVSWGSSIQGWQNLQLTHSFQKLPVVQMMRVTRHTRFNSMIYIYI